jgi:uncharacterized membrane protein
MNTNKTAKHKTKNINKEFNEQLTLGQKLADKIASFGGSWPFLILFALFLAIWILHQTLIVRNKGFDPYPFILLNLILSCLAAIQAPIIMMSQNRHAQKDRLQADHDYEINLKAEIEIEEIQATLDEIKNNHDFQIILARLESIDLMLKEIKMRPE